MNSPELSKKFEQLSAPAVAFAQEQRFRRAIKTLEKIIQNQDDPKIYYLGQIQIGAFLEGMGKYKKAIEKYESIPKDDDEIYMASLGRLVDLYSKYKNKDKIQKIYDDLISDDVFKNKHKNNLAKLLLLLDRNSEAINLLSSITRNDGKEIYAMARTNQVIILKKLKRYDEILPICYEIRKDDSEEFYWKAQLQLADALYHLDRKAESFEILSNISKKDNELAYNQASSDMCFRFPIRTFKLFIANLFNR